jgi:hypothetical protein
VLLFVHDNFSILIILHLLFILQRHGDVLDNIRLLSSSRMPSKNIYQLNDSFHWAPGEGPRPDADEAHCTSMGDQFCYWEDHVSYSKAASTVR